MRASRPDNYLPAAATVSQVTFFSVDFQAFTEVYSILQTTKLLDDVRIYSRLQKMSSE